MRLTPDQVQAIKLAARTVLGKDARVKLFGSRTDDHKRGSDIDLMFETPPRLENRVATQGQLYVAGELQRLGVQQI